MKSLILAAFLFASCATVYPTKQQLFQCVIKTTATPAIMGQALSCLQFSTPDNYASCLESLGVTWGADIIECAAGNYEQSTKSGVQ